MKNIHHFSGEFAKKHQKDPTSKLSWSHQCANLICPTICIHILTPDVDAYGRADQALSPTLRWSDLQVGAFILTEYARLHDEFEGPSGVRTHAICQRRGIFSMLTTDLVGATHATNGLRHSKNFNGSYGF